MTDPLHGVSRETVEKLEILVDLLRRWQARINLVGPSTVDDIWARHISDSLTLFRVCPTAAQWVDMGSGAGFPGLVMAICLAETGGHVDLIESNGKKAAFLRAAVQETGAAGTIHAERIESVRDRLARPDFISARALAPLTVLLDLSEPWLVNGATAFFHKGRDYERELETARDRWAFDLVEHRTDSGSESVLLEIGGLRRR